MPELPTSSVDGLGYQTNIGRTPTKVPYSVAGWVCYDASMNDLTEKTAFVTGASKGIGYSIAEKLLDEGVNVVMTARTESAVQAAAEQLNQQYGHAGGKTLGLACDVRDYAQLEQAVAQTLSSFASLDFLIVNAGVGVFKPVDKLSLEDWQQVIDINLTGAFYTVKAAVEALKQSEGYIITISSLAGKNAFADGSVYNASKFGLTGFTEAMMLDLRPHNIKVSTIMPGSVSTYFNHNQPSEKDAWKMQPQDIAALTLDLLEMHPRTLPSRIEVRPSRPDKKA